MWGIQRRLAAVFVVLICGSSIGVAAARADSAWSPNRSIFSVDGSGMTANGGVLYDQGRPCSGGLDGCDLKSGLTLLNTLAPCSPDSKIACISKVEASEDGSSWVAGSYEGERSKAWPLYAFPADEEAGFGASRMTNLYSFAGLRHDQGTLFEVDPKIQAEVKSGSPISITTLSSKVFGVYQNGENKYRPNHESGAPGSDWVKSDPGCLFQPDGANVCWRYASQTTPLHFRLSLVLPTMPDGWVTGRIVNPDISFSASGEGQLKNLVVVSGQAVTVPAFEAQYFADNVSDKETWQQLSTVIPLPWDDVSRGIQVEPNQIDAYLSYVAIDSSLNKATSETDEWTSNLSWTPSNIAGSGCERQGFEGFVGSNALVYGSALPVFDKANQVLDYRMSSPHFLTNGKVLAGAYSLLVDQAIAKCIWGVTGELGQATLSVTDSEGVPSTMVTSLGISNGKVHFQATGFNFSEVRLKAKITAAKPSVTTVKKITCVTLKKPLRTKIISGLNPKCPSGYKAKG